ncbi:hypothetical protein J6590_032760 [Homalodisca vitripennis]|nr:hypothetical protein J6590_032760 [Homalodisca vitripennis]
MDETGPVRLEEENFCFDRYTFSSWLQDSTHYFSSSPGLPGRNVDRSADYRFN